MGRLNQLIGETSSYLTIEEVAIYLSKKYQDTITGSQVLRFCASAKLYVSVVFNSSITAYPCELDFGTIEFQGKVHELESVPVNIQEPTDINSGIYHLEVCCNPAITDYLEKLATDQSISGTGKIESGWWVSSDENQVFLVANSMLLPNWELFISEETTPPKHEQLVIQRKDLAYFERRYLTDIEKIDTPLSEKELRYWKAAEWLYLEDLACLIVGITPDEYEDSWYKNSSTIVYEENYTPSIFNINPIIELLHQQVRLYEKAADLSFFNSEGIKTPELRYFDRFQFKQSLVAPWLNSIGIESAYFQTAKSKKVNSINHWKALEWLSIAQIAYLVCDISPEIGDLNFVFQFNAIVEKDGNEVKSPVDFHGLYPIKTQLEKELDYYYQISKSGENRYRSIFTPENIKLDGGEYLFRQSVIKQWLEEKDIASIYFATSKPSTIDNLISVGQPTNKSKGKKQLAREDVLVKWLSEQGEIDPQTMTNTATEERLTQSEVWRELHELSEDKSLFSTGKESMNKFFAATHCRFGDGRKPSKK